jgi:hypothetical protein
MQIVVVGGNARKVGKTSVTTGLIRNLSSLAWTAVKITQDEQDSGLKEGEPRAVALGENVFLLTEEDNPLSHGDTCRFLAAGARRALWLRVSRGRLGMAVRRLLEALGVDEHVMIGSNSIVEFLTPAVYIAVLDRSRLDFKTSAYEFLARADALVVVGSRPDRQEWPTLDSHTFQSKVLFRVSARDYSCPELANFVRSKLQKKKMRREAGCRSPQHPQRSDHGAAK